MSDSTVRLVFLGNSASAVRSVRNLEGAFGGLGKVAHFATAAIGVGLVGGLGLAVKAAISFDRSMRNVNSIAKLNETQFKALSKEVLALAKVTAQSPDTLAKGLYDIVSSGFKATEGLKILRASGIAATAGLTDTATATKAVVAVLNAYHLKAGDAKHVSDILFQTVNKGVLSFEELASQIGDVLPVASQLGVPLTDVGGALATITLHGVSAAESATQLKQVLVSLLKPSDALKAELKKMGFESGETALKTLGLQGVMKRLTQDAHGSAKAFAEWFPNVRAMNGALGLTGKNIKVLHENIVAMNHSQGAAGAAFAEQGKSISVQWQKAKASLTAAAIPIGQLLFPALKQGAEWAEKFALGLQQHMPEIRRQFSDLSGLVKTVGGTLGRGALSPAGSSAILGGLATLGTGKAILNVKNSIGEVGKALGAIGPVGIAASIGVGLVTTAFFLIARQGSFAQKQIDAAANALRGLTLASQTASQAGRNLEQSHINVQTSALQVEGAERLYAQAVQQSGRGSYEARVALNGLRQARAQHKQALADEKSALDQNRQAQTAEARAIRDTNQKVASLSDKFHDLGKAYETTSAGAARLGSAGTKGNQALNARKVQEYAAAMSNVARQASAAAGKIPATASAAQRAAAQLHAAASAAAALASSLGRIPSRKEVNIFVRTFQVGKDLTIGGKVRGRAGGGFIPGVGSGDTVPAMLTPGELVLNRGQQEVLGGPRFLASLFGFSGDEGPAFATGGFAKPGHGKGKGGRAGWHPVTKGASHHPLRARAKAKSKAGQRAVAAADAVYQHEQDLDRAYGQLSRQYSISPDEWGNSLDVAEIDSLIAERQKMLTTIDDEKTKLAAAITALKQAIAALLKDIKSEQDAIKDDLTKIRSERRKKKPNKKLIAKLEHDVSSRRAVVGNMQSELSNVRGDLKTENFRMDHEIDFDHRDVELDILDLQQQRKDVIRAISDAKASGADSGGGGGGDVGGGDSGSSGGGAGDNTLIQQLLEEIGKLRLALGIQNVQLPIIGAFAKGTLSVQETGLAVVHAGESIRPAGWPAGRGGGDGGSIGEVHLHIDGDSANAEGLRQMMKGVAISASPQISRKIFTEADSRRRSGRF